MSDPMDRPRLRPGLAAARDAEDPRLVVLYDRLRLSRNAIRVTPHEFIWLQLFNGRNTLREIQSQAMRTGGGTILPLDLFTALVHRLDAALFLDTPRFHELLNRPVREPACIGCYPAEADEIRRLFKMLFTGPGGPGLPAAPPADRPGRLRAALLPHIDFGRGGATFAHGFKELFEQTTARLFVIVATSHYSPARFTLTRQDFQTPLGVVSTDRAYVDRIVQHYGDGLFDDPFAHIPEHSIELEVVFLQFLYENHRPFRIVPLLVGSFRDCVTDGFSPRGKCDIARMVTALQQAEAETPEPVCYIISGDLAHIGPKFEDPEPVAEPYLTHSRRQDEALLRHAETVNHDGYFRLVAEEGDGRRICGLPPTWVALEAARPSRGRLLRYDQYVHPEGLESVSFASMAFDR